MSDSIPDARSTIAGHSIERACKDLPDGWQIDIGMESGSAWVNLYNPDGDQVEFPTNRETIDEELNDAIEFAIKIG